MVIISDKNVFEKGGGAKKRKISAAVSPIPNARDSSGKVQNQIIRFRNLSLKTFL